MLEEQSKKALEGVKKLELMELERKKDRAKQIRAEDIIERVPKVFDPTYKPEQGPLDQISYYELQLRLKLKSERESESLQKKKLEIKRLLEKKREYLAEKSRNNFKSRELRRTQAQVNRLEKQKEKLKLIKEREALNKDTQDIIKQRLLEKGERKNAKNRSVVRA